MDASRFDRLARAWAAARTRRGLLRALGGIAALAATPAAAENGPAPGASPAGACAGRETRCGRRCVDTRKSEAHCGRCRNRCGAGERCKRGKCVAAPTCGGPDDCASGVCARGACQEPTCTDGRQNGEETDIDCGGPSCPSCPNGSKCAANADCASSRCCAGVCAECCDGPDCSSRVCSNGQCQPAACGDGQQNGDETDVDCGGSCPACTPGKACKVDGDCVSKVCGEGICQEPTCNDGVQNGDETGIDCGGSQCKACVGESCETDARCASGFCCGGVCANCAQDQVCGVNGAETCCTPEMVCKDDTIFDNCGREKRCELPEGQICAPLTIVGQCCEDNDCTCGCDGCCGESDLCFEKQDETGFEFCCEASGRELCNNREICCTKGNCVNDDCTDPLARIGSRRRTI